MEMTKTDSVKEELMSSNPEFRELARAAGLDVRAAGRQPSGRFVVECRTSLEPPASSL